MKKVTKKLIVSAIVMVVALSLAATSTYAWFTMDDEPEVEGFDVNVTSVDGLYISLVPTGEDADPSETTTGAAGTFKSYVTSEDVLAAIAAYNSGVYYDAVEEQLKVLTHGTSVDGETFTTPAGVREPGDIETNHYTFRLYFYSTNEYEVMLNTTDSEITSVSGGAAPIEAWDDVAFRQI